MVQTEAKATNAVTTPRLRFGAHMPTAGGLHKSVIGGGKIACDTIQLFTASPKQWKAPPLDKDKVRAFRRAVESTSVHPLVAHDSYLINLASPDDALRDRSRRKFLDEIERAEALGLDFLVTHLGAHTGSGMEAGLEALIASLDWAHEQTPGFRVQVALETTAGQGTALGGEFAHIGRVFASVREPERLRVCLDTCHIFVAGYDIRDAATARATWDAFDAEIGLSRLACIHANDAKAALGSHLDRHAHIGEGHIGATGFVAFLRDARLLNDLPVIVETPEAETCHERNVWQLRRLLS